MEWALHGVGRQHKCCVHWAGRCCAAEAWLVPQLGSRLPAEPSPWEVTAMLTVRLAHLSCCLQGSAVGTGAHSHGLPTDAAAHGRRDLHRHSLPGQPRQREGHRPAQRGIRSRERIESAAAMRSKVGPHVSTCTNVLSSLRCAPAGSGRGVPPPALQ